MSVLGSMVGTAAHRGRTGKSRVCRPVTAKAEGLDGSNVVEEESVKDPQGRILRTIEAEIIPRLFLTHAQTSKSQRTLGPDDVAEFSRIVLAHDAKTVWNYLEAMRSEGVSPDDLRLKLLAPSCRLLGELWAADRCTFAEVSVGVSRIQRLARQLGSEDREPFFGPWRGNVLLAPVPGEQHSFGVQLVGDFLSREGWDVTYLPGASESELAETISSVSIPLLGLTVSNRSLLSKTAMLIQSLRAVSANRGLVIIVGGTCLTSGEASAESLGADAAPADALEAASYAQRVFEQCLSERAG